MSIPRLPWQEGLLLDLTLQFSRTSVEPTPGSSSHEMDLPQLDLPRSCYVVL